jgi:hypothetical protein
MYEVPQCLHAIIDVVSSSACFRRGMRFRQRWMVGTKPCCKHQWRNIASCSLLRLAPKPLHKVAFQSWQQHLSPLRSSDLGLRP